ncbi:MAG: hypothetical protein Q3986_06520 [Akkermansia sp.]|nr:hypothetical protein [Akkermansia sp.]
MSTYKEIKTAALGLSAGEQDKLLAELTAAHAARKAGEQAEKTSGWKRTAWKIAAAVSTLAGIIFGGVALTGCTSAVKQSQTAVDGSVTTTERVFSLSATEARDLIKLYGIPQIPCVNVGK